jgi:hypothetical protein
MVEPLVKEKRQKFAATTYRALRVQGGEELPQCRSQQFAAGGQELRVVRRLPQPGVGGDPLRDEHVGIAPGQVLPG